ncbi:hypothetical protein M8494_10255 [Serratia ureilytica]
MAGGAHVGQRDSGLNFSDPGLLLDAACNGLGIALVSQLPGAARARRRAAATVNQQRAQRQLGVAPARRAQPARPPLLPMAAVGAARRRITPRHDSPLWSGENA